MRAAGVNEGIQLGAPRAGETALRASDEKQRMLKALEIQQLIIDSAPPPRAPALEFETPMMDMGVKFDAVRGGLTPPPGSEPRLEFNWPRTFGR
jgi:hypothetical protein